MWKYVVDVYSKRTGKLVECKAFYTKEMAEIYFNARTNEGLWIVEYRH